ncbi:MAG TPA: alanine racemase [Solirubrobacteraceae bacterium]|nr:alanine racemase [Solirubrobacteraceae bacterium]
MPGREALETATAALEAPFAVVDLDAFDRNAADLLRRAGGTPIRLSSKSVRCRALIERALRAGLQGILAFTLPEALWLAEHGHDDLVVAYPTADRSALRALASGPHERVTIMVDCAEHLDLAVAAVREAGGGPIRVCLDVDAGWWPLRGRIRIGARRSPVRTPEQAAALARAVLARGELHLDGLMSYEAHIAGVGDRPPGRPLMGAAIRAMQRASARELAGRRAAVVAAVRAVAPLRFVNGGGTGSVERTAAEAAVTEVAAGSGLYGPTLFDAYGAFRPQPAALFALPVVRRPDGRTATLLGGGYPASGAAGADRLPAPHLPPGLKLDGQEGAGEVQTPLRGPGAAGLRVGDRVWMRHAKAGELCERFDRLHLISAGAVVDTVPTYRGEGKCFL